MVFAVAGGGQLDTGSYQIDNSLRFNKADTPRLVRTPSESNRKTFTLSCWVKRSAVSVSYEQSLYEVRPSAGTYFGVSFRNTGSPAPDELFIFSSAGSFNISLQGVFRDVSAWYHIVLAFDTTQATSSNRIKMYVNGNQVSTGYYNTYPAQNTDLIWNTNNQHTIGGSGFVPNDESSNFYLSEIHHIDGQQLDASSFGEFDSDSGIWKPKQYSGSYGTNGFYLDFENSGSLGADQSGNGNNFTPTNLASTDQMLDTPTNNFCVMNPLLLYDTAQFSQGNLRITQSSTNADGIRGTIGVKTGKWYWEIYNGGGNASPGIATGDANSREYIGGDSYGWSYFRDGNKYFNSSGTSYGASFTSGDVIGIALDMDNNQITFYKNNAGQGVAFTSLPDVDIFPGISTSNGISVTNIANFGQDSSFAGSKTRQNNTDVNGYGDFYYTPPSGFLALCTQNLATELTLDVDKSTDYFNSVLWTGTGSQRDVTGLDFQPDWVWIKSRGANRSHKLYDSSRGVYKALESDTTDSETSSTSQLQSFNSDGFGLGSGIVNNSGEQYVGWCWKAGGGSTSTNNDGGITSTVQANTTSGFSIALYTGIGTATSFGHGLGVAPKVVIVKSRSNGGSFPRWYIQHPTTGPGKVFFLDIGGNVITNSNYWGTAPDSSKVYIGNDIYGPNVNGSSNVAYCFAEVEGFSKFGSYIGNGSSNGPFIYTGFRPAFILLRSITTTQDYNMFDTVRSTFNVVSNQLRANQNFSEDTGATFLDILSNGFKCRNTALDKNQNGVQYVYFAFAENPFATSTGVAGTAR